MAKIKISIQLYTLRKETGKDLPGVLKTLKKIGYAGAELAGYGNLKNATEVKKAFDDAGLEVSGAHVGLDQLQKNLDHVIEDTKILGHKNVIIPVSGAAYHSAEGFRKLGQEMTEIGGTLSKNGIMLSYHNHAFEFKKYNDQYGLDILWEHSDHKTCSAEVDVFWVMHGGEDPAAYIKKIASRVHLLHLKDMNNEKDRKFAPVGTGIIDFKAINELAVANNVEWGAVEQDDCYGEDPIKCVETSFNNLVKLGIA